MDENNQNRIRKIEEYLLDPDKVIFESLTDFEQAISTLLEFVNQVDFNNLETIQGEDGYTPQRGVDYMTEEDISSLEAFIMQNMPIAGVDYPTEQQAMDRIKELVAKIPRIKGDKGEKGTAGKDGKDGSADTGADIVRKLRNMRKEGLKISDIKDLTARMNLLSMTADEVERIKETLENVRIYVTPSGGNGGSTGTVVNTITGEDSVNVDSTDPSNPIIKLVNDEETPGNLEYYGTNGAGVKGFHAFPTAGAVNWGDIGGTLSAQTDLQNALNTKLESGDNVSELTNDAGYLTSAPVDSVNGATGTVVLDADDIDDTSTTHKFVTASDLTTLSNTSGTNTGDQTLGSFGITATSSELNILDGATVSTAELNILDGVTATTTELNYTDGVTSNIQTQLDDKLEGSDIASGTITPRADDIDFSGGSEGDVLTVQSDGSLALETPSGGGGGVALFKNIVTAGSGTSISDTYTQLDLNTEEYNSITGCSLTSNVVTLPAGTYKIEALAPITANRVAVMRLYDKTNSAELGVSMKIVSDEQYVSVPNPLLLIVTLAGTTEVELQMRTSTGIKTVGDGTNNILTDELYTTLLISEI